jgi:S-adenosylmethionine decarboxylase
MLTVGTEWLIEASGCDAGALRDPGRLRAVFARAVEELGLRVLGEPLWHKFDGEGGVTGLAMLTESHLACHTYPEFRVAAFNLYCCRERPEWPWADRLGEMLGATDVRVRSVSRETRGARDAGPELSQPELSQPSPGLPYVPQSSLQTDARGGDA